MTNQLAFHETKFNVVNHNGQIWLTAVEIAKALQYKTENSVSRIYARNSDEFSAGMSESVNLTLSGNLTKAVRIFSLRGAHLIAMFARTAVAKEFRRWVLDILDREVGAIVEEPAKPKSRQCTATQLIPLRQAAERLITTGLGNIYPDIWKLVHQHFDIEHIHQLQPEQISEAIEHLNVLEGEYLAKERNPAPAPVQFDFQMYVHNANAACMHMDVIQQIWREELQPCLKQMGSPLAGKLSDRIKDAGAILNGIRGGMERASGYKGLQYK